MEGRANKIVLISVFEDVLRGSRCHKYEIKFGWGLCALGWELRTS